MLAQDVSPGRCGEADRVPEGRHQYSRAGSYPPVEASLFAPSVVPEAAVLGGERKQDFSRSARCS